MAPLHRVRAARRRRRGRRRDKELNRNDRIPPPACACELRVAASAFSRCHLKVLGRGRGRRTRAGLPRRQPIGERARVLIDGRAGQALRPETIAESKADSHLGEIQRAGCHVTCALYQSHNDWLS